MRRHLERALAILAGLLVILLLLELSLRVVGGVDPDEGTQPDDEAFRVMCIGESTTAMGGEFSWPAQLELLLNERGDSRRYQVINRGLGGADSSVLMARLDDDLEHFEPHMVVVMMGMNDTAGPEAGTDLLSDRRAVPDHGESLADRSGPARWFKTWRLAELLLFELGRPEPPQGPAPPRNGEPAGGSGASLGPKPPPRGGPQPGGGRPPPEREHRTFLDLLGVRSDSWTPEVQQAVTSAGQGQLEDAVAQLEGVVELDPGQRDGIRELAILYEMQHDNDKAEQAWRRLDSLDDPQGYAKYALARLLARRNRCDESSLVAEQALAHDPIYGPALAHLGLCWTRREQPDQAKRALRRAGARHKAVTHLNPPGNMPPQERSGFHERASSLYAIPGAAKAWTSLGDPLMRNPQDPKNDLALLLLHEAEGQPDLLAAEVERLSATSTSSAVHAWIAQYHRARMEPALEAQARQRADRFLAAVATSATRQAYDQLEASLLDRGIPLVVSQYANRPLAPLRDLRPWDPSVVLVDNHDSFQGAIARHGFDALFYDHCYGDLGHGTLRGNQLLATNIAAAIDPVLDAAP